MTRQIIIIININNKTIYCCRCTSCGIPRLKPTGTEFVNNGFHNVFLAIVFRAHDAVTDTLDAVTDALDALYFTEIETIPEC